MQKNDGFIMYGVGSALEHVLSQLQSNVDSFDVTFGEDWAAVMELHTTEAAEMKAAEDRLMDMTQKWLNADDAEKRKRAADRVKAKAKKANDACRIFADGEPDELVQEGDAQLEPDDAEPGEPTYADADDDDDESLGPDEDENTEPAPEGTENDDDESLGPDEDENNEPAAEQGSLLQQAPLALPAPPTLPANVQLERSARRAGVDIRYVRTHPSLQSGVNPCTTSVPEVKDKLTPVHLVKDPEEMLNKHESMATTCAPHLRSTGVQPIFVPNIAELMKHAWRALKGGILEYKR